MFTTPLLLAVLMNNIDAIRLLIKNGADVERIYVYDGLTSMDFDVAYDYDNDISCQIDGNFIQCILSPIENNYYNLDTTTPLFETY